MLKFCALSSGSSGNCYYIASEKTGILIDAGISCTKIKNSLAHIGESLDDVAAVFVTHEHSDHISGLKVLLKKYPVALYLTEGTYDGIPGIAEYVTQAPMTRFRTGESTRVGDLTITSYKVSHDAKEPVCYKISSDSGENVGIITDLGWADPDVIGAFEDCDLLLLESNHDVELLKIGPYQPFLKKRILSRQGHLSNDSAGVIARNIIAKGRLQYLVLGHLSETNNHADLAYETVHRSILECGYESGKDYELDVSVRNQVGKLYQIRRMLVMLLIFAIALFQMHPMTIPSFADELLLREHVTYDIPVLNMIVVKDGKTLEFVGRKLNSGVFEDYDARFEIGSLARVTTSLALMELMERHQISPDSEISSYLPAECQPEHYSGIRFQDVFTYSTGFVNHRFATLSTKEYAESVKDRALQYLEHSERKFDTGEYALLSNTDFALMTLLVEELSREHFIDHMHDFFVSKNMKDTYVEALTEAANPAEDVKIEDTKEMMPRYYSQSGQLIPAKPYHALIPAADSLVTTLSDMERLLKILTSPELPKSYNVFTRMFTNINAMTAKTSIFNYYDYNREPIFVLDSALPGSTNRMIFVPDKRIGMFIGYNTDNPDARNHITDALLEYLGIYAEPTENKYIQSESAGILEGYYSPVNISSRDVEKFVSFSHQLKISRIDEGILIGEDYFRPISELVYFSETTRKYARFITDEDDRLRYLVLDNELYERSFSGNIQILLLFILMSVSALLLILIILRWNRLIAGRVDDRPRVWLLFSQVLTILLLLLTVFAVRETGYWDIAYGGGLAIGMLRYFGWANVISLISVFFTLAYTRGDYKWSGMFRMLNISVVPLLCFYTYWLFKYRFLLFF